MRRINRLPDQGLERSGGGAVVGEHKCFRRKPEEGWGCIGVNPGGGRRRRVRGGRGSGAIRRRCAELIVCQTKVWGGVVGEQWWGNSGGEQWWESSGGRAVAGGWGSGAAAAMTELIASELTAWQAIV